MNDHNHDHDHEQPHPYQPDIEDAPFTHYQVMAEAVIELLTEKNVVTADEFRAQLEMTDSKTPANGAKLVARAWTDPAFKERLMANVNDAAEELGIDAGHIPLRCVENTPDLHNVIVCTLCSCYPRMLIGLPPGWYKSRAYRARTVKEPRTVLREFGTEIADNVEVRVHDATADLRYMVLPHRPDGTENLSEDELAALVTRDCLIGVSVVKAPGEA